MGIADYFNGPRYRRESEQQQDELRRQRTEFDQLKQQYGRLQELAKKIGALELAQVHQLIEAEKASLEQVRANCNVKALELESLQTQAKGLQDHLLVLEEELLLESFALYHPKFALTTSAAYKDRLDNVRARQKALIKSGHAATGDQGWTVNNSATEGRKLVNDMIKLVIRSFNNEADYCVDNVKFDNIELGEKRINKSFEVLNKLGRIMSVRISDEYRLLKIAELQLAHEFQLKKQAEKEEAKRLREELREQQKLEQEIRAAREKIAKERKHFTAALKDLTERLAKAVNEEESARLREKIAEVSVQCNALDGEEKLIDYREQNAKAGYVYVISNIGAFGEGIFKIGMTRRLEPVDRVDELGDASVPFTFDIHALVFSENAPALEAKLHERFHKTRLNKVNSRKEFFRADIEDIEDVIRKNFDSVVEVVREAPAEQYRESLRLV
jgi:hypothetical protein